MWVAEKRAIDEELVLGLSLDKEVPMLLDNKLGSISSKAFKPVTFNIPRPQVLCRCMNRCHQYLYMYTTLGD